MKDILGGLLMLVLVFGGGYCTGKHYEQEAQQAEVDRLNTEARAKEVALAAAVTTTANALRVSNEKAKTMAKQRDAAIDAGALKLRVKATCAVPAATNSTAPAGSGGGEASAELDRETAKNLIAIAEEGDRAITKLNACITLYNNARSAQ